MYGGTNSESDLMLLFPPLTEARHFPYLSLPQMTGYLRSQGFRVAQYDLNIDVCEHLFTERRLAARAVRPEDAAAGNATLAGRYRRAMAALLAEHAEDLSAVAFGKQDHDPRFTAPMAVRLVQQGIELLLEDCAWARPPVRLEDLKDTGDPAGDDPVVALSLGLLDAALERERPAVVGISVAFFSQLAPSLRLAGHIKRRSPGTVVVLGGQQIMMRADDLSRLAAVRACVDALCTAAGEEPLARLLALPHHERSRADIPGLVRPRSPACAPQGRPTLAFNQLPPPDFDGLPVRRYLNTEVQLPVSTCVGCYWGRCVFCSYGNRSLAPGAYQQATAEQIADACERAVNRYGVRHLTIADENTNLRLVVRAMRLVRDRGLYVDFRVRNRLEPVLADPAFCRELADLGCVVMSCGYETNSQRLLDAMDKGVDAGTYQQIIDNLHDAGIALRLSVMGGLFDETTEEAAASREFLVRNASKIGLDVLQMLVLEPGTLLAQRAEGFNLLPAHDGTLQGNPDFSYLSGRMGPAFTYAGGGQRQERARDLAAVFQEVNPAKNAEQLPGRGAREQRAAAAGGIAAVATVVRLHPWVRMLDDPRDHRRLLADFAWDRLFALPPSIEYDAKEHVMYLPAEAHSLAAHLRENDLGPSAVLVAGRAGA